MNENDIIHGRIGNIGVFVGDKLACKCLFFEMHTVFGYGK